MAGAGAVGVLAFCMLSAVWGPAALARAKPKVRRPTALDPVWLTVVVRDEADHLVRGLGPQDVDVIEDGAPRPVAYFREAKNVAPKVPLSIVLLLDASGSMREQGRDLQEGIRRFVRALEPEDSVLIVDIHGQPILHDSGDFTGERERLESKVAAIDFWGGTNLFDAIGHSIERLQPRQGRRALVVLSDGEDTASSKSLDQVLALGRSSDVTVYGASRRLSLINLDPNVRARARRLFTPLSSDTGGEFLELDWAATTAEGCERIVDELHAQYLLGYVPGRSPDGSFRSLEVTTEAPGLKVHARRVYLAASPTPTR